MTKTYLLQESRRYFEPFDTCIQTWSDPLQYQRLIPADYLKENISTTSIQCRYSHYLSDFGHPI